jgi:hypothetical protein
MTSTAAVTGLMAFLVAFLHDPENWVRMWLHGTKLAQPGNWYSWPMVFIGLAAFAKPVAMVGDIAVQTRLLSAAYKLRAPVVLIISSTCE